MLKIFNSFTKKKENFYSDYSKKVNIYVCGITVSGLCHIGHARTFIFFDILIRYLRYLGYKTNYVRNITDIDDKIIKKSSLNKESFIDLSHRMINFMHEDFSKLNLLTPDYEPKVTENISKIIYMISILLENGHAYLNNKKDVLFSVSSYKNYGFLSRRFSIIKNFSENFVNNNHLFLKNNCDFILWKNVSNITEPRWFSPWGFGRPGWHIECSAMSNIFFPQGIDIHGGGIDLLFPHHENEYAQSLCIKQDFFVKYWMHTGMLIVDNNKMSKSLKNDITIRNLLSFYDDEIIRFFFLSTRYRHPFIYFSKNLYFSKKIISKMYSALVGFKITTFLQDIPIIDKIPFFLKDFFNALNDDFNTPLACSILYKLSKYINKIRIFNFFLANHLASLLFILGNILGFFVKDPNFYLSKYKNCSKNMLIFIENSISLRNKYRKQKKWKSADEIRKKLLNFGVIIEDNSSGSLWYIKSNN